MIVEEVVESIDLKISPDGLSPAPKHIHSADDAGFVATIRHLFQDAWAIRYFFVQDFSTENGRLPWSPVAALARPAGLLLVFAGFFSIIGAPPVDGTLPFPLFVLSGLVAWNFIERVYWSTANSFAARQYLMANMAVSRLVIPVAVVASAVLELVGSLVMVALLTLFYDVGISEHIWALPFVVAAMAAGGVGLGIAVATAGARLKVFHQIGPIFIRFWFFGTPIFYQAESFIGEYVWIYNLVNPAASFVELVRWSMFSLGQPIPAVVAGTGVYISLVILGAVLYFQSQQGKLGDCI